MKLWEEYYVAQDVDDALRILNAEQGQSRIIAGGTDLLLDLRQGRTPQIPRLIDVTSIPEMTVIEKRLDRLFIGAGVPLKRIVHNELVQQNAQALMEACSQIGGSQVRNTATLGGNVAHALPAADGTISLLSLGANAEVATLDSRREVPLVKMFKGPGVSVLDHDSELLVGFYIPLHDHENTASGFKRVMRPQGVAIAILNMAIWIRKELNEIGDIRVSVGPAGPRPFRAYKTEESLRGTQFSSDKLNDAVEVLLSETSFRTSRHRSTSEYRQHIAGILFKDLIQSVWQRI